ncbi:aminotransferase class I/II-fold pyridoxal phosphate-dependent enzyme [Paenibacillus sp. HW567]|uniref:aminotransferase class I/II-fold pyridoxal phosphate-dependent enzyme n=1 Tax=Paenibacillus sp. HW567 TaxID=1034769 RepID=UPI0003A94E86|nr:PLP-dependent aminotransferase family protein [Paenibacillus sp. HW567]
MALKCQEVMSFRTLKVNAFRSYNAQLLGVDIEPDGISIEQLEETLKTHDNIKLLYTIPNFQNPTGVTMSLAKRKAVYELAKRYGVMILEDNPYGEVRFHGEDIPSIKSLDTEGIVIYVGSFSKVLSAGIRVGYVLAPLEIARKWWSSSKAPMCIRICSRRCWRKGS